MENKYHYHFQQKVYVNIIFYKYTFNGKDLDGFSEFSYVKEKF